MQTAMQQVSMSYIQLMHDDELTEHVVFPILYLNVVWILMASVGPESQTS